MMPLLSTNCSNWKSSPITVTQSSSASTQVGHRLQEPILDLETCILCVIASRQWDLGCSLGNQGFLGQIGAIRMMIQFVYSIFCITLMKSDHKGNPFTNRLLKSMDRASIWKALGSRSNQTDRLVADDSQTDLGSVCPMFSIGKYPDGESIPWIQCILVLTGCLQGCSIPLEYVSLPSSQVE